MLIDVNRTIEFGALMRPAAETAIDRLLPTLPQRHGITIIANADNGTAETVARVIAAGQAVDTNSHPGQATINAPVAGDYFDPVAQPAASP